MERAKKTLILVFLLTVILGLGQNCGRFKPDASNALQSQNGPSPAVSRPPPAPSRPPVADDETLTPSPEVPTIEYISVFKELINNYGNKFCKEAEINAALTPASFTEGNVWYYDGTLNYHNIARYTQTNSWYTCSDYVARAYRGWINGLSLPDGDFRPLGGWRLFPHGLLKHFIRTNETADKDAALRLATRSAYFSNWDLSRTALPPCGSSREAAYLINSILVGKELGTDQSARLAEVTEFALGHLDQWFVAKTCLSRTDEALEMQPFMVGLTTEALLFLYEKTSDEALRTRILQKVEVAMDELWTIAWRESAHAMISNTVHESDWGTWPVVNVLIGATYAWLWQVTGTDRHRERADKLWNGTMTMDFPNQIWGGKQFSQIYRRAFDFLKWRGQLPGSYRPPKRY